METHIRFVLGLQFEVNFQKQEWEVWNNKKNNKSKTGHCISIDIYPIELHWHLSTQLKQVKLFTQQKLGVVHNTR